MRAASRHLVTTLVVASVACVAACGGATRDGTGRISATGSGGSGGAAVDAAGTETGGAHPTYAEGCEPLHAHEAPAGSCTARDFARYTWDGENCVKLACCAGSQCDHTFATADECDHGYSRCYSNEYLRRTCDSYRECGLARRACCGTCSSPTVDQMIALATTSVTAWEKNACDGTEICGKCGTIPNLALTSFCDEGQCAAVDLAPVAACSTSDDCVLLTRSCCAACEGAQLADVISVSKIGLPAFEARWCTNTACADVDCGPPGGFWPSCDPLTHTCYVGHEVR